MSFGRFLLVRLGWSFIAVWLAATIVFLTFRVVTFQPRDFQLGTFDRSDAPYRAYAERAGLQYSIPERYARFLAQLVTDQSSGRSVMTERSSRKLALESIPATLALVLPGLILALLLASALAIPWSRGGPIYAAFLGIAVHFLVDLITGALDKDLRGDWPFARIHSSA